MKLSDHLEAWNEARRQKAALRSRLREARAARPDDVHLTGSYAICASVLALLEQSRPGCILGFWPIVAQREVDISPVLDELFERGVPLSLPVIRATATQDGVSAMHAHRYTGRSNLRPGQWGVFEPVSEEPVPREEIAVVVVPALALDANGYRLGYGQGYYDRFLAGLDTLKIGVAFEDSYRATLPVEAHDVRVDLVVTERRLVRTLAATWLPRKRIDNREHIDWAHEHSNSKTLPG